MLFLTTGDVMHYFTERKSLIENSIRVFLESQKKNTANVNIWGPDLCDRLCSFALQGKMLRGGLLLLAHDLFGGQNGDDALRGAAAMELFQSAFLIHDDIMDRDEMRRGQPSLFAKYMKLGNETGMNESRRFGESMGICAGDAAFFWGYALLASMSCTDRFSDIMRIASRELSFVGIAQMQDVTFGHMNALPALDDIMNLYLYKTSRYTFSMPFILGSLIAGRSEDDVRLLCSLGDKLGIIFQIKDDELGLFGDEAMIGKVSGSDIRENKKSIYLHYLFSRITGEDKERCEKLFGSNDVTEEDIHYVRTMIIESGIRREINRMISVLADEARIILSQIQNEFKGSQYCKVLQALLDYSLSRSK
jgi:geranylgeranyl diphosphate synthase, type I